MKWYYRLSMAVLMAGSLFAFYACGGGGESEPAEEMAAEPEETMQEGSNRGTASATFGEQTVSVNYGRPKMEGRDMLAQATDGMVWRMGMNEATTLSTSADLAFGDTVIPAGDYSLFMKKVGDGWELIFNSQTGQWGTEHDVAQDVASVPMMTSKGDTTVNTFTIEVTADDDSSGELTAMWGTAIVSCGFTISD